MSAAALTNAYISINSNVLSTNGNHLELNPGAASLDASAFGSVWEAAVAGLLNAQGSVTFIQDFAVSALDSIMWPLFIARALVPFEFRADAGARSTGNPGYTGNLLILGWPPFGNSVGELATVKCDFKVSGAIARQTA